MKKTIIIMASLLLLTALSVTAQTKSKDASGRLTSTAGAVKTSSSGTDTSFVKFKNSDFYSQMTVAFKTVKSSGTVAALALLQGSNDDVTYYDITTDTLTIGNTDNVYKKFWQETPTKWRYYRVYTWATGGVFVPSATIYFGK